MNTVPQMIDFTFRVIVLILAMTVGSLFVVMGARNALAANLKPAALITGSVFTVGDIFSGLTEETAGKVLGPAPQPGQDMVLNARTLMRIAAALELPWQPANNADQIVIRRAATLVPAEEIKTAVVAGLKEKGISGPFEVNFVSMAKPEMILPHGETPAVELASLTYDPKQGRFEAALAAPSKQNPLAEMVVVGKVEHMTQIPVLKKMMTNGDIINAYDIEWIDVKNSDMQHNVVLNEDDLVGMTPRRMLDAATPVRATELERPQLVSRGDMITITYNDGMMMLTAQGKAMQNGGKGDLIRVVNTSSNQTVEAFVEADHIVTIIP